MSTRRNIDKLYLSKFEAAEVTPPEHVWQQIASRLPEEKQKRRMFPFWYRIAGAAAILLLLVNLERDFFSTVSTTPILSVPVTREDIHKEIRLSSTDFTEVMLQVSMTLQEIMRREQASTVGSTGKSSKSSERITVAIAESEHEPSGKVNSEEQTGKPRKSANTAAENGFSNERDFLLAGKDKEASSNGSKQKDLNSAVALEGDPQSDGRKEILPGDVSEENAIAEHIATELSGSKVEVEEAEESKISISTRVAPVFYEHIGSGNTVGASMAGSEASGEVSVSYGINLAYQVSDRFKIRSGINKLDLSFSTPGVPMAAAMSSGPVLGESDPFLMSRLVEGDLQQQMDFIEVPIEVEYRLLDSWIGLNLIGGGSTLFLNSSNVSMDTGIRTTYLGQAENMEKLNFSANIGLGLDYELTPGFWLSLEPMFKYQLNSLSKDTEVRPYYYAIYSGFSISF